MATSSSWGEGYNGVPAPNPPLQITDNPSIITSNITTLNEGIPDARTKLLISKLTEHLHAYVNDVKPTTEEWMNTIQFLTRTGQKCTDVRQEFILLSDVFGISALVDALNNPPNHGATESTILGPFFTADAPDLGFGESIVSDAQGGVPMWVEGRVLSTDGEPIPDAVIDTWETDANGMYDTQYTVREQADCRGRLKSNSEGNYSYRAIVPVPYPIPNDGPVGELLGTLQRHNMRPSHLHVKIEAKGYRTLVTALYFEGDQWNSCDAVYGVKKSLICDLKEVSDPEEAKKRGMPKVPFKLLEFDFHLLKE
ncbi:aromatic compound dioxygenase [Pterulicium gracile]|uniref:Aromatic compound dioxygenase n=1 Tax=Pterulicium gracile TaxID=1884261 RepID=A0A5C3QS66_9AGAR|nr:aromatic compound dioxygenase [Pterula gracilis]